MQPWGTQVAHSHLLAEHFVLTVGNETLRCCWAGLGVSDRCPIDVEVLVVDWKLLEYDLLFEVIIKRLGSVCATSSGTEFSSTSLTFVQSHHHQ